MQESDNTPIAIGMIKNKYIIIEIFAFSTKRNGILECERLLWGASKRHRKFLKYNKKWYSRLLIFGPCWDLFSKSKELDQIK